ncbi:stage III sporulation protein AF [Paenibacillus thalictri]|uniref:Stage III sporulation protein AF n=1 Tax=Paenibacillus thalictri TaxID=2527873 RepID=A0A4Q9DXB9_9BACL|nr:stage III sporulation protein AF [Paenibacillus thalictri]TBL79881.1 stage III sporulation protein AF [Paenibacillus thalictri]
MEWLGGWLRSVVLVIMLATFIDLLLPNQSMQRYVKTVVSLFILLTLMNPIFTLFQKQWNADQMFAEASAVQDRLASGGTRSDVTLSDIERQSEQLQQLQKKQSKRLAETQIAQQIRDSIEKQSGYAVKTIRVDTTENTTGQTVIGNVSIALQDKETGQPAASSGSTPNGAALGKPIQPVTIDVQSTMPAYAPAKREEQPLTPEERQGKTAVQQLLEKDWQLKPEQLQLTFVSREKL